MSSLIRSGTLVSSCALARLSTAMAKNTFSRVSENKVKAEYTHPECVQAHSQPSGRRGFVDCFAVFPLILYLHLVKNYNLDLWQCGEKEELVCVCEHNDDVRLRTCLRLCVSTVCTVECV